MASLKLIVFPTVSDSMWVSFLSSPLLPSIKRTSKDRNSLPESVSPETYYNLIVFK